TGRMNWAILLYAIVLFPGVLLHELSHWLVARLLGVRTGAISLLPRVQEDGTLRLGYVEYYRSRSLGPLRESLIGGAPLISGMAVVLLVGFRVFDIANFSAAFRSGSVDDLGSALTILFTAPDFLVWLYLIFAVSNAMMPSPSDRRAWPPVLILLVVVALVLYLLDRQQVIIPGIMGSMSVVFGYLALALSLAIGVDAAFIFVIYLLEGLVSRIRGVQLIYESIDAPSGE
ncbi:MAG TPA: hypothetical protein VE553_03425, partial [Candidatus Binatia bacterium]|nr:hypothetical protein [Candidatus Binatia bacterium]